MSANGRGLPPELNAREAELRTYYRHLPDWVRDKEEGRYAVIKGDEVFNLWDTYRDAMQYARYKFPDGGYLAQVIDARFLTVLQPFFAPAEQPAMSEVA